MFVLMPGHAGHDFAPEPTASELKSKVATSQNRSGVLRCHPSLENHRSKGRQAPEQTGILLITCTASLLLWPAAPDVYGGNLEQCDCGLVLVQHSDCSR